MRLLLRFKMHDTCRKCANMKLFPYPGRILNTRNISQMDGGKGRGI